jgi:CRISPR-associated protein Csd2
MSTNPAYGMPTNPNNHIVGAFVFDVCMSNPNGDPDNGGHPRQSPDGHGYVTPMRIKRMIRDYGKEAMGWSLYVDHGVDLTEVQKANDSDADKMKSAFTDVRLFGGVLTQAKGSSRCRGPIQFSHARSVDPIELENIGITRVAGKIDDDGDLKANMGHYAVVQYGVYVGFFTYNPIDGAKTGVTSNDLTSFFEALVEAWGADRSTQRPEVNLRALFAMGSQGRRSIIQEHQVASRMSIEAHALASSWKDVDMHIYTDGLPNGVTSHLWQSGGVIQVAAAK